VYFAIPLINFISADSILDLSCSLIFQVSRLYNKVGIAKVLYIFGLGRPRRRWEDNIKMDLQEVGGGCEDWMELAQDRGRWRALVGTVMNLRVPKMRGIS